MNKNPYGFESCQPVSTTSESAFLSYKLSMRKALGNLPPSFPRGACPKCHVSPHSCADTVRVGWCHRVIQGTERLLRARGLGESTWPIQPSR